MTNTASNVKHFVRFADGSVRELLLVIAEKAVGLDADGDVLVPLDVDMADYLIPLTPCCNASGKGGGNGVVCRACYRDVSYKYGGRSELVVARVR